MVQEALHEELKPFRLKVSWPETKGQLFGGLLDETVLSVHVCGGNIEILENFTYLGSVMHNDGGSSHEIIWRMGLAHSVIDSLTTSI